MSDPAPVLIPLLNPNEPEALLACVHVKEGQHVSQGELLFTLETTKSAEDVASEKEGYVSGLRLRQGQTVRAGEVFCSLAESASPQPSSPEPAGPAYASGQGQALPEGVRITQPAFALALAQNLDLSRLPIGPLVTESLVRSLLIEALTYPAGAAGETPLQSPTLPGLALPVAPYDPTAILIYGGGGHGKILIDLLKALGVYRLVGILDDGRAPGESVLDIPMLGGAEILPRLYADGVRLAVNGIGGIGNVAVRIKIFHRLAEAGFTCPAVIHPTAYVERSASLAAGTQVLAHVYLGSAASAGYGAIISTGAIVSHDCLLGNYVNISPGAILAGEVQVGDGALIGMGVTVNLGVKIGAGARLGNGATVNADVPEGGIVRAGTIWPR